MKKRYIALLVLLMPTMGIGMGQLKKSLKEAQQSISQTYQTIKNKPWYQDIKRQATKATQFITKKLSPAQESVSARIDSYATAERGVKEGGTSSEDRISSVSPFFKNLSFFAIYDGHGGPQDSEYAKEHFSNELKKQLSRRINKKTALRNTFHTIDNKIKDIQSTEEQPLLRGSTVAVALIDPKAYQLTAAWAGDARVIVLRNNKIVFQTKDHSPEAERKRIEAAGLEIKPQFNDPNGPLRVNGMVAVARALGDFHKSLIKNGKKVIISDPDIERVALQPGDIILVSSDGIFEGKSLDTKEKLEEFFKDRAVKSEQALAQDLITKTEHESTDDLSVIVIKMP